MYYYLSLSQYWYWAWILIHNISYYHIHIHIKLTLNQVTCSLFQFNFSFKSSWIGEGYPNTYPKDTAPRHAVKVAQIKVFVRREDVCCDLYSLLCIPDSSVVGICMAEAQWFLVAKSVYKRRKKKCSTFVDNFQPNTILQPVTCTPCTRKWFGLWLVNFSADNL